jgi:XTP/dITP diphosphohydrolase
VTDRLLLVATSPRLPAGLLSWPGWEALRSGPVFAAAESDQVVAVRDAGIEVTLLAGTARDQAFAVRDAAREGGVAVWLAGPDGDPEFARLLGDLAAREGGADVEVVYGSYDPPGARLLDVVAVMDRLRVECPWDRKQTHQSLAHYLIEEAFETLDSIAEEDLDALREELGDVLLQVAFHSRVAEEHPEEPWSIDDVAGDLVDKLIRRHPHVFADVSVAGAEDVQRNWDEIKQAEKGRTSVTEGIPLGQPALTLAAKLQKRAESIGYPLPKPASDLGSRLFALVAEARAAGEDPEEALRAYARQYRDQVADSERSSSS